jgi:glycosyltransferase involved in cell wall biosynthesis
VATARTLAVRVARPLASTLTHRWPPRSRLFLVGENAGWAIDQNLAMVGGVARRLGVRLADRRLLSASRAQAAFFGSQFTLLREPWQAPRHALATSYFHGRPGTPGMPEFDEAYGVLRARHAHVDRVQVTHEEIEQLVLSTGIDRAKVFRIPIGVDIASFSPQTPETRAAARRELGLPHDAFVVGSFHKDGVGWAEGDEPKWIKGPDVLLEALEKVRERVPELHVLLSGPARGFVKRGLDEAGIAYVHRRLERYGDIATLYAALDVYVVPSRQEGGPNGVLESMASGVPVVSTRVGQAQELVRDGENGWLVDVDDADALAARVVAATRDVVDAGLATARANAYDAQLPLWRAFFDGFVDHA